MISSVVIKVLVLIFLSSNPVIISPEIMSNATTATLIPNLPPNAARLPQTKQLDALMTIIRDQDTKRSDFIFYSDRIIRLLVEEGEWVGAATRKYGGLIEF